MHEKPGHITLCDHCKVKFFPAINHLPVSLESLHSDTVPTEAERLQTIAIIQGETHELQRYKEVRTFLEQVVDELKVGETALEHNIRLRRSWASHIRRVPRELWCNIFELVCLSGSYALNISACGKSEKRFLAPALALSQVSSHWRRLANGHPKVWSSISLDIFQLSKGGKRIVKLYLRNSGTRPLRLRLEDTGMGSRTNVSDVKAHLGQCGYSVLQMLFKLLPVCSELTLELPNVLLSSIEPRCRTGVSLPLLRNFEWVVPSEDGIDEDTVWFWVQFFSAPQLKEISIFNDWPVRLGILPYRQLTTVSIGWASLESVFSLLTSCENLLTLVWSGLSGDITVPSDSVPIVASNLQELSCSCISLHDLEHFFASITVPSAISIDISSLGSDDGSRHWREDILAAMLERSGAPLEELKLDLEDWCLTLHGLEAILNTCPGLKSLELQIRRDEHATPNSFVAEFLPSLSVSDGQTCPIIPQLTRLRLHEISVSEVVSPQTIQAIIQMIESRSKHPQYTAMDLDISFSTKRFSRFFGYSKRALELEQDIISRVEALEKNGARCVISWIEPGPSPWGSGRTLNASGGNHNSDDNNSESESSDEGDSDSEDESDEDFSDEGDDGDEDSGDEGSSVVESM
uniref:Uncharacterized protein n=1 Tax=Moniliophthora roreri TaxID=221103 RepID=A0A0W0F5V7_MONRR